MPYHDRAANKNAQEMSENVDKNVTALSKSGKHQCNFVLRVSTYFGKRYHEEKKRDDHNVFGKSTTLQHSILPQSA